MNRGEFTRAVFEKIGAHIDGGRLAFGVAWAAFESTEALNNPWATTEPYEGATDYNSVGVKNYASFEDGVDATVRTLVNGYYEHLLKVLRNPESTIRECLNVLDASPWGSHPNTLLWQDVVLEYAKFNKQIPGSTKIEVKDTAGTDLINTTPSTEGSEQTVDNETPQEDTLESRLAALPKEKSIQEIMDEQDAAKTTETVEETGNPTN